MSKKPKKPTVVPASMQDMSIVTIKEACAILRYSRTHLYRLEKAGKFIRRVQIGPGRVGYYEVELRAWMDALPRANYRWPDDSGSPLSPSP